MVQHTCCTAEVDNNTLNQLYSNKILKNVLKQFHSIRILKEKNYAISLTAEKYSIKCNTHSRESFSKTRIRRQLL